MPLCSISQRCTPFIKCFKNKAIKKGASNNGNTLPRILQNANQKVNPSWGSTNGKTKGTRTAPNKLDNKVYVVNVAAFPPSLPVITAAAVAVGQIKQTIIPCQKPMLKSSIGIQSKIPAVSIHDKACIINSHKCHHFGFKSFTSILQKVKSNWAKISHGVIHATNALTNGLAGERNSKRANNKYANVPANIASGSVQLLINFNIESDYKPTAKLTIIL